MALVGLVPKVDTRWNESRQQVIEGLVVVDPDALLSRLVVLVDVDLVEERLVEQSPSGLVGFEIRNVAVTGQVEGVSQHHAGFFVVGVGGRELPLNAAELVGDAVLFRLEQVERDRSGVVGGEQFLALGGQLNASPIEFPAFGLGSGLQGIEVIEDERLDAVTQLG